MTRKICNMCGREMDTFDLEEDFGIHTRLGYGTKYDGCWLELDLCCHCMELLIEECEISPIVEEGSLL